MAGRPDIAIMLFDLAVSGVARNAVRVANAAHAAGLKTEMWLAQASGELRDEVDPAIIQRDLGARLDAGYSRRDRKLASKTLIFALAANYAERRPWLSLSSGNHFHDLATAARREANSMSPRLIGRVSNAAPNSARWGNPLKIWRKRRKAAARYAAMDHLVAVSCEIRDELAGKLGVAPGKISLIRNGVDIVSIRRRAAASPPDWPWDSPAPTILGVGRIVPQKNFELLLDAFAIARQQLPLRLAIIGDGPLGAREALMERARALGVASDVWLPGHRANPFPYYRHADLFVLSSRWEGMSNALLEAIACGCPAVAASSAVGAAEILENGRFGLIAAPQPKQLARAILASLAQRMPAETLMARAGEFDLHRSLAQYVELFHEQIEVARRNAGDGQR